MKKLKSIILLPAIILLALIPFATHAQGVIVQLGGVIVQPGTYLKFTGTPYFVIPRMLASDRTGISSHATGLLVYQTDAPAGFYYYNGTQWVGLGYQGTVSGCIEYDGNAYPTFMIGTQQWMAENLRVTHYRNGDAIPNVTDGETLYRRQD